MVDRAVYSACVAALLVRGWTSRLVPIHQLELRFHQLESTKMVHYSRGSRELSVQQARIFLGHGLQNLVIYSLVGLLVNKHLVVQWLASRRRDDASKRSPVRAPPSLTLEEFFCTDEESLVLTSHVITLLLTRTLDPVNSGKFARRVRRAAPSWRRSSAIDGRRSGRTHANAKQPHRRRVSGRAARPP